MIEAERRAHARAATCRLVRVKRLQEVSAFIAANISEGGLFLEDCPAQPGERLDLDLEVEELNGLRLSATAEVVRRATSGVGARFVEFREGRDHLARLVQFLLNPRVAKEVLLIDDSPTQRMALRSAMRALASIHFSEAENGTAGLAMLGEKSFDAVVTDLNMPEMDGFSFIGKVRTMEGQARRTPIIVVTAQGADHDLDRAFAMGVTAFLQKPVRPADLVYAVCRAVGTLPTSQ